MAGNRTDASERRPAWLEAALDELGTREIAGRSANPRILGYFRRVKRGDIADDATAWCAAFVGAMLEDAGHRSTRSLRARSYLKWGRPLSEPVPGAIAVFSRGPNPALGHVGFVLRETARAIVIVGGNQSDAVTIESYPKSRLLALRAPADEAPSAGTDPLFDTALAQVLKWEGGFTDDPVDPGGPTFAGVTLENFARWRGQPLTAATRAALLSDLRRLGEAELRAIYWHRYWQRAACDTLHPAIALIHFDCAVNQGPHCAVRILQKALGVAVDGELGPITRAAAGRADPRAIVREIARLRRAHYESLPHFWRFGRGWLNRLDDARTNALRLLDFRTIVKGPTMPTKPTTAPKWWGESLTIWGTIVTALSTVLPIIGPFIGLDISGEMIEQLGESVTRLLQATGGVIGVLMAIFGRFRAKAPLQRRPVSFNF